MPAQQGDKKKIVFGAASLVLIAGVVVLMTLFARPAPDEALDASDAGGAPAEATRPAMEAGDPGEDATAGGVEQRPVTDKAKPSLGRKEQIGRIKARIGDGIRTGAQSGSFILSKGEKNPVDERTMDFLKAATMETRPLLKACYSRALEADSSLFGVARANITIVADEQYGALVEMSDVVGDESISGSDTLVQCLRETLYELRFEPRHVSGRMVVGLPLIFASVGYDGGGSRVASEQEKQMHMRLENWLVGDIKPEGR